MAMFSAWIVYAIDEYENLWVAGTATQGEANGFVAAHNAAWNGKLQVSAAAVEVPENAQPQSGWYFTGGALGLMPSPQFPLRAALRSWHTRLVYLGGLLSDDAIHASYPSADIQFGRDILHALHQGAYYQHHTSPLTTAQQLLWLQASALGPADATGGVQIYDPDDPETFFEIAATIPAASKAVPGALSLPNPLPEVDGTTFTRRNLADALVRIGENDEQPTVAQLNRGRWIDGVNA